jgi:hypothetical protein
MRDSLGVLEDSNTKQFLSPQRVTSAFPVGYQLVQVYHFSASMSSDLACRAGLTRRVGGGGTSSLGRRAGQSLRRLLFIPPVP